MKHVLTCCLALFLAVNFGVAESGSLSGWGLILQDYNDGLITKDQKVELALTLLQNPESLPERYQIERPMKDATSMIIDISSEDGKIDPIILQRHGLLLNRVNKQFTYDTPEGNFRIHYDVTGSHAVYLPDTDVDPADGVPDYVNRTGEYFERSWYFQCDTLGYDTPPYDGTNGGGTDLYDVYLHHYSGAYGVTWPESYSTQRPNRNYDMTSYIYVDPTYAGFGYGDRLLPLKVTSAHELFHAVQFAYNANAGGWFMENCATWMEDEMWDDINDNHWYLPSFMNNTHYSLNTANGGFEYGAFLWPTYIDEALGLDVVKTIWEWAIYSNAFNAVVAVLDEYATGIPNVYPDYAVWNYITGQRDDGEHYEEANEYNQVRIMRTHTTYPIVDNTTFLQPQSLGCNYVLLVSLNIEGDLHIQFDGADAGDWRVPVVKSIGYNQHEIDMFELDGDGAGEYIVHNIEDYVGIAFIPCLLTGPTSNYSYSAYVEETTDIAEDIAVVPDDIQLLPNYPNPFNSQTVVSFNASDAVNGMAKLDIYNQLGRKVGTISSPVASGLNRIMIDTEKHNLKSSGIYFYRLSVNDKLFIGKMTYLK